MNKLLAGAFAVLVVAGAGCAGTAGHRPVPPATVPAVTSPAAAFLTWYGGSGRADYVTVNNDVLAIEADIRAGDIPAAESEGSAMEADAATASADPSPVGTTAYTEMMAYLGEAGDYLADGDTTGAVTALEQAVESNTSWHADLEAAKAGGE
jgi:hypothetical protein